MPIQFYAPRVWSIIFDSLRQNSVFSFKGPRYYSDFLGKLDAIQKELGKITSQEELIDYVKTVEKYWDSQPNPASKGKSMALYVSLKAIKDFCNIGDKNIENNEHYTIDGVYYDYVCVDENGNKTPPKEF